MSYKFNPYTRVFDGNDENPYSKIYTDPPEDDGWDAGDDDSGGSGGDLDLDLDLDEEGDGEGDNEGEGDGDGEGTGEGKGGKGKEDSGLPLPKKVELEIEKAPKLPVPKLRIESPTMFRDWLPEENTHLLRFNNLTDMASETLAVLDKYPINDLDSKSFLFGKGKDFGEPLVHNAIKGVDKRWDEGLEIYELMMRNLRDHEMPKPKSIRRRSRWSEYEGDEIDIDRLRRGQEYWRQSYRDSRPGPLSVTIVTDVLAMCFQSAESVLWRGAAAVCLTKLLEETGYRVELWAGIHAQHAFYRDSTNLLVASCLKRGGDMLDISTLINAVSGWCMRGLFLSSYHLIGQPSFGRGQVRPIGKLVKHITPDEQVTLVEKVWSEEEAVSFVRAKLEWFINRQG